MQSPEIFINLVGLKILVLKNNDDLIIEKDWKYSMKEHYPLFSKANILKGSQLVFKFQD